MATRKASVSAQTVMLWCGLTEQELLGYGQDIAEDERRLAALAVERKDCMKALKDRRDQVSARISSRAEAIAMKRELRPVAITVDPDGIITRGDNGERVGLHEISAEDRQALIDFGATSDED